MKSFEKSTSFEATDFHPVDLVPEWVFRVEIRMRDILERRRNKQAQQLQDSYLNLQDLARAYNDIATNSNVGLKGRDSTYRIKINHSPDDPDTVTGVTLMPLNLGEESHTCIDTTGSEPVFIREGQVIELGRRNAQESLDTASEILLSSIKNPTS